MEDDTKELENIQVENATSFPVSKNQGLRINASGDVHLTNYHGGIIYNLSKEKNFVEFGHIATNWEDVFSMLQLPSEKQTAKHMEMLKELGFRVDDIPFLDQEDLKQLFPQDILVRVRFTKFIASLQQKKKN